MNLQEWLAVPGNTSAKLARLSGVTPAEICRTRYSRKGASLLMALKIDCGTNGEVEAESICPEATDLIQYFRTAKLPAGKSAADVTRQVYRICRQEAA